MTRVRHIPVCFVSGSTRQTPFLPTLLDSSFDLDGEPSMSIRQTALKHSRLSRFYTVLHSIEGESGTINEAD